MSRESTKQILLDAGRKVFSEKGYNNSGIEAILQAAGVPKGSFYYYFDSKEDFGLQVINSFAECYAAEINEYLGDENYSPLDRLKRYFESRIERVESKHCRNGCLVGTLSQEMADQSEVLRARLVEVFEERVDRYEACLREAQEAGELSKDLDARELAEFWINSWQGAMLRAKTIRSTAPLRTFLNMMFGYVLQV